MTDRYTPELAALICEQLAQAQHLGPRESSSIENHSEFSRACLSSYHPDRRTWPFQDMLHTTRRLGVLARMACHTRG